MENQIALQNQIQIKGINLPKSIEKNLFVSLPKMLQMEISQEIIAQSDLNVKQGLADDVMRLLNVRDRNAEMAKDWLLFISNSNFKVTAGEIYLAFTMALTREILDDKGKEIDLFPELSNNTTGKVISAYLRYKKEHHAYQLSRDKLKSLKSTENKLSENEISAIRENLLKLIFEEVTNTGFCSEAYHLFSELESKGKIVQSAEDKKNLYVKQLKKYELEEKAFIRIKFKSSLSGNPLRDLADKITGKKPVESVANRCRSILVSNYLKENLTDYETFKNQFNELRSLSE